MKLYVDSVAVLGPGLEDWDSSVGKLAGREEFVWAEVLKHVPEILPPTERRRCGASARLAIYVAHQVVKQAAVDPAQLVSVFATSGSDLDISQKICLALAQEEKFVSPTLFHNSVHNAAVGYWSIASGSQKSSNSLSAYDWSAASGLLAAASQAFMDQERVLLVCYDTPVAAPMDATRHIIAPFGAALILDPVKTANNMGELNFTFEAGAESVSQCQDAELEKLRLGNSAARILPLLCALAGESRETVKLEAPNQSSLRLQVQPC